VPKWEQRLSSGYVVVSVPHEQALPVLHFAFFAGEEQEGGIDTSEKDIDGCRCTCLPSEISPKDGFRPGNPGHFHGASIAQYPDRVRLRVAGSLDKRIVAFRQSHMVPVKSF